MEYTKGEWQITEPFGQSKFFNVYVDASPIPEIIAHKIKEANAQLISAAPKYHELIKDMMAFNVLSPTHHRGLYARAKRIQAKVEGKMINKRGTQ